MVGFLERALYVVVQQKNKLTVVCLRTIDILTAAYKDQTEECCFRIQTNTLTRYARIVYIKWHSE